MRDERQGLVEVDRARDRLADVGDELELVRVSLRLLVQPGRLDRHGDLRGGRSQRLDLAPVGAALIGAVVADLEHAGRATD